MGRRSGSKKGGSKSLEAAAKEEKEVSPAKRRRMASSDSTSPGTSDAATTLAAVANAAHLLAGVSQSINNSRRGSLATVSFTVEDTEAENNALGTALTTDSIPDISLAARKSFADILQGLQGSDLSSLNSIAAQAAQAFQKVQENEIAARKSVDATGSLASMTAAAAAATAAVQGATAAGAAAAAAAAAASSGGGGAASSSADDTAAVVAAQKNLQTQMMQASDMAAITAQANAAAAQVASNGSANGPRRGRRSNPGPISGFAQPAMMMNAPAAASGTPTTASMLGLPATQNMQTLMSSILQPSSTPASATPATPLTTAVFSPAMEKANFAANTAHAQTAVSEQMKKKERLEKNRKAAKQCRLKKKEYQRVLEERVKLLETRQAELMDELMSINSEMSPSDLAALQQRIREKYQQPIAAMPQAPPDTPHSAVSTPHGTKTTVIGIPGTAILAAHAVPTAIPMAQLRT